MENGKLIIAAKKIYICHRISRIRKKYRDLPRGRKHFRSFLDPKMLGDAICRFPRFPRFSRLPRLLRKRGSKTVNKQPWSRIEDLDSC